MKRYLCACILITTIGCSKFQINRGTTILVSIIPDSIIMMADSRSQYIPGRSLATKYYLDTVNKIRQVGNFFYEIAGTVHFRDIDLYEIIKNRFDTTKTLKDNGYLLYDKIFEVLTNYYTNLTPNESSFYDKTIDKSDNLTIYIAGFENGIRVFLQLEFVIKKGVFNYNVAGGKCYSTPFSKDAYGTIAGGHHNHILSLLKNGFDQRHLTIKDLEYFIKIEADSSSEVGHGFNYVVITKDNHYWGKSY